MAREDKVEVFRVVNGIEDGENGTAGVTNCMPLVTIPFLSCLRISILRLFIPLPSREKRSLEIT
jgi:hypothetical protein